METTARMNELLDTSLQYYTDMLELLQQLQERLEFTSMTAATSLFGRYQVLEQEARTNDELLVGLLQEHGGDALDKGGGIRLDMLKKLHLDVQAEIRSTVTSAGSIKMLLANEMSGISHGRTAMQGYKSHSTRNGKILNGSY